MSYSEDNISAKSADMEYSVRARKRDQQAEQPSAVGRHAQAAQSRSGAAARCRRTYGRK